MLTLRSVITISLHIEVITIFLIIFPMLYLLSHDLFNTRMFVPLHPLYLFLLFHHPPSTLWQPSVCYCILILFLYFFFRFCMRNTQENFLLYEESCPVFFSLFQICLASRVSLMFPDFGLIQS